MMIEPLDELGGRAYQGIVLIGSARSGKSFSLVLGGITYEITCSPADTLVVCASEDHARKFSRTDLSRTLRSSPALEERMSPRPRDDNVHDKWLRNGALIKLAWPTIRELSASTYKYVFITDYERPDNRHDVDGGGPMWDLAFKRVETFMSRGKCLAESSPGEDYADPRWRPSTPHEAPPARGILNLYNLGTRARWYWRCLSCRWRFEAEPGYGLFRLPPFEELERLVLRSDLMSLAEEFSSIACVECGALHTHEHKPALNGSGRWLHEGERFVADSVEGERRRSNIASYWLGGVAAPYQRWDHIVLNYLQAVRTYATLGDESMLRAKTQLDAGAPYLPRAAAKQRTPEAFIERLEDWEYGSVPAGVRFLVGAVDVQARSLVVEVWGYGVAQERWLIDRFSITGSRRREGDRFAALDPAAYAEDWDVLLDVINRRYRGFGIPLTLCDSGGKEGVTVRAYDFWRRLRSQGLGDRLMLAKGVGAMGSPRCSLTWPDSRDRKDRHSGGRGDVPVWLINVNVMKDAIAGDLDRRVPGPGYVHLPKWIQTVCPDYFKELTAEARTEKGWQLVHGSRNEAFDLHAYGRAAVIALKAEQIDWERPPEWITAWSQAPQKEATTAPQTDEQRRAPNYIPRQSGYLR